MKLSRPTLVLMLAALLFLGWMVGYQGGVTAAQREQIHRTAETYCGWMP